MEDIVYKIIWSPRADKDIQLHIKAGNIKLVKKIDELAVELSSHPRIGKGSPEKLKNYHLGIFWSRRIDEKHRLIYRIDDKTKTIFVASAYSHYGDK